MTAPDVRHRDTELVRRQARAARWIVVVLLGAGLASLGLLVIYVLGGAPQLEGLLLFVAFSGIGLALGIWSRQILPRQVRVEPRYPMTSDTTAQQAFESELDEAFDEVTAAGRRGFLVKLLAGVGGILGVTLLLPLRSLGPGPGGDLRRTAWHPGRRIVTADGQALRPDDVIADQAVTVFPEGATGEADSQAVLIGARPEPFDPALLAQPTVDNLVVYSKICTHAGCPVGLYRAPAGELLCPCHQSTFDVYRGAVPLTGPAARALPQLPVGLDDDGFLIALGDFATPVGPSYWNISR